MVVLRFRLAWSDDSVFSWLVLIFVFNGFQVQPVLTIGFYMLIGGGS